MYKKINQQVQTVHDLINKPDLTLIEFKQIINFSIYDCMIKILGDTRYPKIGDYSFMSTEQAEAIQSLEHLSTLISQFKDKIAYIARENLKQYILKYYPDKARLIDWASLNWNDLNSIYELYNNKIKIV